MASSSNSDQPNNMASSSNSDQPQSRMASNSDLQQAKLDFEDVLPYGDLEVDIKVRRRMMGTKFCAEDLTFVIQFKYVGQVGNLVIGHLKANFDNGMKRYCFFSCQMTSGIYSGMQDLYNETEEQLASSILRPLLNYLVSKKETRLDSNLEVKCTICSLDHTAHQ